MSFSSWEVLINFTNRILVSLTLTIKLFIAVQNLINPRLLLYCFGLVIKNPNRVFDQIKSDNKSLDTVPLTP